MTDIKQLPENLKELEQKAAFKSVYKKHTVEQLQELLIEAGTDYLSDDNKAALTWRYMDAKGMAFDGEATSGHDEPLKAPIEPNDEQKDVINDDKSASPTTEETKDDAGNAQETPKTDVSNDGNGDDGQERSTDATTTTAPTTAEVKDDQPVGIQTQETTDHGQTDTPVSTDDNSLPTIDSGSEEQPSATDAPAIEATSTQGLVTEPPAVDTPVPEAEREFVEVTNNGAYNFYETATGTMVTARRATKIYATATIDKAHILRNINQYNQTRGNLLQINKQ